MSYKQKVDTIQAKKQSLDINFREQAEYKLKKWDEFRVQKNRYLDIVSSILKSRARVKILVGYVYLNKIMPLFAHHFQKERQYQYTYLTKLFMAIRLKSKFYRKFKDRYGHVMQKRF